MSNEINPMAFFQEPSVADLRLLACPGAEELTKLIDQHLVEWAKSAGVEKDSFIIPCECPRFQSGDAKGLVRESVRGDDIFIVIDPGNYSVTYNLFGYENHLSPDDHFANLKRLIQAVAGKAHRVSVIMPSLYGGRQHRRVVRESLDCAVALQELQTMGVRNIITFDAHSRPGTVQDLSSPGRVHAGLQNLEHRHRNDEEHMEAGAQEQSELSLRPGKAEGSPFCHAATGPLSE